MSNPRVERFKLDEDLNIHCVSEIEFHNLSRGEALLVAFWNTKLVPYLNGIKGMAKKAWDHIEALEKTHVNDKAAAEKIIAALEARITALEKVNEGKKTPSDKYPASNPDNRGR